MAFEIYPLANGEPLKLNGSEESAPHGEQQSKFTPLVAGTATERFMFIRIAAGDAFPPNQHPEVSLRVGANAPVILSGSFQDLALGQPQISAKIEGSLGSTFLVRVALDGPGPVPENWSIRFKNRDSAVRRFVWVVGDTTTEAQKPWIHVVESAVDFAQRVLVGRTASQSVHCLNYGTGELTVTAAPGLAAPFSLAVPVTVPANTAAATNANLLEFAYGPTETGRNQGTSNIESTDTRAVSGSVGHNNTVALSGSAGRLEVGLVLDDSTSMNFTFAGGSTSDPTKTRWSSLVGAVGSFFNLLVAHAGSGEFHVVMFPGNGALAEPLFTRSVVSNENLFGDGQGGSPEGAYTKLQKRDRFSTTPLGAGIELSLGPVHKKDVPEGWGQFRPPANPSDPANDPVLTLNRRVMLLMSDGAHNTGLDPKDFFVKHVDDNLDTFHFRKVRAVSVFVGTDGVGNETGLTFMNDLARISHEGLTDVDPNDRRAVLASEAEALQLAFERIATTSLGLQAVRGASGTLTDAAPEARHTAQVTPFDRKISFLGSWSEEHAMITQLVTPRGEILTPASATPDSGVHFHGHARGAAYTIDEKYLRNEGGASRYGAWTFLIKLDGPAPAGGLPFQSSFIFDSSLELEVALDKERYHPGDEIKVAATLTTSGRPVPFSAVTLSTEAPLNARTNFLASQFATPAELAEARTQLEAEKAPDITSLLVKERALTNKGIVFTQATTRKKVPLLDPQQGGVYRGTFTTTEVPGNVTLHVVAVGETADGSLFRREHTVTLAVDVLPNEDASKVHIDYAKVGDPEGLTHRANVRAWPRDAFGNVVLVAAELAAQRIALLTSKGRTLGALLAHDDGSYTQEVRFIPDSEPVITLRVDGVAIIDDFEIPPIGEYKYVNQVVKFTLGREAAPGANKHADPKAALGNVLDRAPDTFVSLGGGGSIVLEVKNQIFVNAEEVTVFVRPDDVLRRYQVDVLSLDVNVDLSKVDISLLDWKRVGEANGITQTFDLDRRVRAVRITDLSNIVLDPDRKASPTPGVSLIGVGFGT